MIIKRLTRKIMAPLFYARHENSPGVFPLFHSYRKNETITPEKLKENQIKLLRKILIHARDNTDYYRDLFSDISFEPTKFEAIEQLENLPILTKELINKNIDRLLAKNISTDERHKALTGGTSGVRMKFYRNNSCRPHRLALQWRSDYWAGWRPHDNVAYIWPTTQDFDKGPGFKAKLYSAYFSGVEAYYAGHLNRKKKEYLVNKLMGFKADFIRCFPSPIVELAKYILENDIVLTGIKGIVASGEPLYPNQKELIEAAFKTPVYNLYASREVGTTASECEVRKNMHIAIDSSTIEVVDTDGKQLPNGEYGELLITDMLNYGMPLIRYRIGDFGQLTDEQCSCGRPFPMMENVVGRASDSFIDENGSIYIGSNMQVILIGEGPPVGQVQIIQHDLKRMTVRLSNDPKPDEKVFDFYSKRLKETIKGIETISFEVVDKIEQEQSGKFRFVICEISDEDKKKIADKNGR